MAEQSLQHLFCTQRDCRPEEYEHRAFRELLYGHAKLLAIPISQVYTGALRAGFPVHPGPGRIDGLARSEGCCRIFSGCKCEEVKLVEKEANATRVRNEGHQARTRVVFR